MRTRFGRLQKGKLRFQGEGDRDSEPGAGGDCRGRYNADAGTDRAKPVIDQAAEVVVFGYHRFEKKIHRPDTEITPEAFEAQMQELKDKKIAVISMQDFLAWKRGEKRHPVARGYYHDR